MSKQMNISTLIEKLKSISESRGDSLEKEVAHEALSSETPEGIQSFFSDLSQHGCISGMVSSLIYYHDTEAFFDKYYEEIIWLKSEYEESMGQPMEIAHQVKNYLAWFAFEETARKIAEELGLGN